MAEETCHPDRNVLYYPQIQNEIPRRDYILVEQLNNFSPNAHRWLLAMINKCFIENRIPTMWKQSQNIIIRKPGKYSAIPNIYRPICLVCHTYTLYEILILNRIAPTIELHQIKEQAGFRPGKSFTSQLLNITQHIQDCYQESMITGIAFVDLSNAKYTVNQILLIM